MNSDHAEANLPAPAAPDDDSRKRILDAALSEFTENGMAGARVSAIAAQAGVNQQLIYYYYGSKAQLYQHVIEWRLGDGAAHYQDAENVSSTRWLSGIARHLSQQSDFVRLSMWEALSLDADESYSETDARIRSLAIQVDRIREMLGSGVIRSEFEAQEILFVQLSLAFFPIAFPQMTEAIIGSKPADAAFWDSHVKLLDRLQEILVGTPSEASPS